MGKSFDIEVQGLPALKKFFAEINYELSDKEIGTVIRAGGVEVTKAAKASVPFGGSIGRGLKRDMVTSKVLGGKGKPHVIIGPAFKETKGKQKIAVIAQHMTVGFKQTPRMSRGRSRGVVKDQKENAVFRGYETSENQRNTAMNRVMQKKIIKIKSRNRGVLI